MDNEIPYPAPHDLCENCKSLYKIDAVFRKTTQQYCGLNMIAAARSGRAIKRNGWKGYIDLKENPEERFSLTLEDMLAHDWEIVEKTEIEKAELVRIIDKVVKLSLESHLVKTVIVPRDPSEARLIFEEFRYHFLTELGLIS